MTTDTKQAIKETLEKIISIYTGLYSEKLIHDATYYDFKKEYPALLPDNVEDGYILAQMNIWCQEKRHTGVCFLVALLAQGYLKDHYGIDSSAKYLYANDNRFCHCVLHVDTEEHIYYDVLNPSGYTKKEDILWGRYCYFTDTPPVEEGYWTTDKPIMRQFIIPMQRALYGAEQNCSTIDSIFKYNFSGGLCAKNFIRLSNSLKKKVGNAMKWRR